MPGYLVKFRCMEESQARNIFSQLLSALEFCHSRNVVHRDIKVRVFGNILWIFLDKIFACVSSNGPPSVSKTFLLFTVQ